MNQNIAKAENWLNRMKNLTDTKNPEYVKEHIDLLDWLIKQAKGGNEHAKEL